MHSRLEADFFPVGSNETTSTTATSLLLHALETGVPVSELLAF